MNAARTPVTAETVPALTRLAVRGLASSDDRPAWLSARRGGITATEVKKLLKGGAMARMELVAEKQSGEQVDLSGNKYVARGNEREPIIADWVERRFGIRPNNVLFHAAGNVTHLATPDGVGVDFDESLLVEEIKTSKHDLHPLGPSSMVTVLRMSLVTAAMRRLPFWSYGYYEQVQWQLWVTGAVRCLFVWEQHDDNWPNPVPVHMEPQWIWIDRDEEMIAELVRVADLALVELGGTPVTEPIDFDAENLAASVLDGRVKESAGKKQKEEAWKSLVAHLESKGGEFQQQHGRVRINWTPGGADPVEVPDVEAAKRADPELFAEVTALSKRWNDHAAKFTKTVEQTVKPSLTVTETKGADL